MSTLRTGTRQGQNCGCCCFDSDLKPTSYPENLENILVYLSSVSSECCTTQQASGSRFWTHLMVDGVVSALMVFLNLLGH
ncbi:hypothetical protein PGIGA_G00237310 [Pangasianodon gigas]|uniref:Uncharacterized protein n=1 Tax=Pangasianodon gigas TaxID=30993 RepID=A0ACC5WMF6_PANGG|nr:hypothetical protein [Pangasianodon gigas]